MPHMGEVCPEREEQGMLAGWGFIIVAVLCVTRVAAIAVALRGVPASRRAEVLSALAECFRWWRWRT